MKLIIDIPEPPLYRDMYTAICENGYISDEDNEYIAEAIKNGKPYETIIEFADRCRECRRKSERVLNKIDAEIEQIAKDYDKFDDYRRVRGLWIALDIIDKYRNEVNHETDN